MPENLSSSMPLQPLNVGNVVSAGLRLYRSNLKTYLRQALYAHLWILVPIYGWAKYGAICGLISRLAFGTLINQPESVKIARSRVMPRLWSFLRVGFQVGISLVLAYIGLAIVATIVAGIIGIIIDLIFGLMFTIPLTIGFVLLILLASGILTVGVTWFYSRWIIAEVPLAVEENINGGESVTRSWNLSQRSVWRIQLIVLVAFLVSLPIVLLFSYLPQLLLLPYEPGSTEYNILYVITLIISLAGGVFVMPFWQAIKAVLYYDLISRREGFGLKLRDERESSAEG